MDRLCIPGCQRPFPHTKVASHLRDRAGQFCIRLVRQRVQPDHRSQVALGQLHHRGDNSGNYSAELALCRCGK